MISPVDCKHDKTLFIASERGPDARHAHAHICERCGRFGVWINGERLTFTLVSDEQVTAAGQYAQYLAERGRAG